MAELLTCKIVRPDKLVFEGKVASVVLVTHAGELGVWPLHAAEIVALGKGIMRVTMPASEGGQTVQYACSGGYAEIANNLVLVLADNALALSDVDPDEITALRQEASEQLNEFDDSDSRRAFYRDRVEWYDLLLAHT
ncbi:MAG: ATP synthase F1 subunit epsilon [Atopobiaceae bacterium]|nr:ATP synthase F1 subunit epsilon [Atopobiaceae bacterium]